MIQTRRKQKRGTRRIGGARSSDYIAMDCEMVQAGKRVLLAEVTLVDWNGQIVYHSYVKPNTEVTNYRFEYSGITAEKLAEGKSFTVVQAAVIQHLQGKILVGHSLENDLKALRIRHSNIRDVADMPMFLSERGQRQKLKVLALKHFGITIQEGHHTASEDAMAAMALFRLSKKRLEKGIHS
jgi:RNA exonuclease 4